MPAVVDGECFFSPRHVCQELGLAWTVQRVKIMADSVRNSTVKVIDTVAQSGKNRTISMLSGWLFTINKVTPESQNKLNLYRT